LFAYYRDEKLCSKEWGGATKEEWDGCKMKSKKSSLFLSLSLSLSLFLFSLSVSLFLFISLYRSVWMSCLVVKMTGVHSEIVGNRGSVRREVLLRQVRCSLLRTPLPTDFRSALWIGREQWGWNAIYSHSTPVETRERVPFCCRPRYRRRDYRLKNLMFNILTFNYRKTRLCLI